MSAPEDKYIVVCGRFDYDGQSFAFFSAQYGKYVFCLQLRHVIVYLYLLVHVVSSDGHLHNSFVRIRHIVGYIVLGNENDTVVGISGLFELLVDGEHICLMAVVGPSLEEATRSAQLPVCTG